LRNKKADGKRKGKRAKKGNQTYSLLSGWHDEGGRARGESKLANEIGERITRKEKKGGI